MMSRERRMTRQSRALDHVQRKIRELQTARRSRPEQCLSWSKFEFEDVVDAEHMGRPKAKVRRYLANRASMTAVPSPSLDASFC